MMGNNIILFLSLICVQCCIAWGADISPTRVKRGFFQPSTIIKYKTVELIKLVPKACIYMDPYLPDCKNVRTLPMEEAAPVEARTFFIPNPLTETPKANHIGNRIDIVEPEENNTINNPTHNSNNNWFFQLFNREPVVVEEIIYKPKIVEDPNIAVTYYIKDCKPQKLPAIFEGVESCQVPIVEDIKKIIPTQTVLAAADIKPTDIPQKPISLEGTKPETAEQLHV